MEKTASSLHPYESISNMSCKSFLFQLTFLPSNLQFCRIFIGISNVYRCHGNSCSWYSAVYIIFMVHYQVMLHEQFGQMALILVDVCGSYWPQYACPVFLGHSVFKPRTSYEKMQMINRNATINFTIIILCLKQRARLKAAQLLPLCQVI